MMTLKLAPNVTILPVITTLDIPVERVAQGALDSNLKCCFVIGETQDGELYFSSTTSNGGTVLWWMEKAKFALMGVE